MALPGGQYLLQDRWDNTNARQLPPPFPYIYALHIVYVFVVFILGFSVFDLPGTAGSILLSVQTWARVFDIVTILSDFPNIIDHVGSKPDQDLSLSNGPDFNPLLAQRSVVQHRVQVC